MKTCSDYGHGAQVLPLELVPLPRHGAQISVRAPTKGYVQTGARAWGTGHQVWTGPKTELWKYLRLSSSTRIVSSWDLTGKEETLLTRTCDTWWKRQVVVLKTFSISRTMIPSLTSRRLSSIGRAVLVNASGAWESQERQGTRLPSSPASHAL